MTEIKLIKCDVVIAPLDDQVCEHNGDNCTFTVTHSLRIDLRAIGTMGIHIGDYCETCATELAKRIQESLPEDDGTQ